VEIWRGRKCTARGSVCKWGLKQLAIEGNGRVDVGTAASGELAEAVAAGVGLGDPVSMFMASFVSSKKQKVEFSLDFPAPFADFSHARSAAAKCQNCSLWARATQTVFGEGPVPTPVMLVGEQPGDWEDLEGRPFVGPAGKLLNAALDQAGLDRSLAYNKRGEALQVGAVAEPPPAQETYRA
jgi:hypothetical protein